MGILPNSAFTMRKSTCKQIKATLSRVNFIRNKKEIWTHFPDLSQLVQTQMGKKEEYLWGNFKFHNIIFKSKE